LAAWNKERSNSEPPPSPEDYAKLQLEEIRDIKESLALYFSPQLIKGNR
jgi:hypothetical protein